jgi:hypothetical protein
MDNLQGLEVFAADLDRKMWITRGARFNAHERLMSKHKWSTATISVLSGYVIVVSLLEFLNPISMTTNQINLMTFIAIGLAIFILVLSLLEASKSYERKAIEFHECGRKISTLYARLLILRKSGLALSNLQYFQQQCELISSEYESILNEYHENHEVIDNDLFRSRNSKEFKFGLYKRATVSVRVWFSTWLVYVTLILLFPFLILLLFIVT